MEFRIAVHTQYLNNENTINSFLKSDSILLFEREPDWQLIETIPLAPMPADSVAALRGWTAELIRQLPDCRVLAGGEICGLPYQIFTRAGFSLFTIREISPEVLEGIAQDVLRLENVSPARLPESPGETETPGIYFFDLSALQRAKPEISSKMALQPFLSETPFLELRLQCEHIPPWLSRNYQVESIPDGGQTLAVITKKDCDRR